MMRLIDADALKRSLTLQEESGRMGELLTVVIHSVIDSMPIIEERKTGKWVDKGGYIECSNCGCLAPSIECADKVLWKKSSFCPDCGAIMVQEGE